MPDVSFYNPSQQEAEIKRRRMMAQQLSELGKFGGNEVVDGIVVAQSPLEQLTKGLSTGLGAYNNAKANSEERDLAFNRQKFLAEALSKADNDPRAAANALLQDPSTADVGTRIMADVLAGDRQDKQFERQQQLISQREAAQANAPTQAQRDWSFYQGLSPEQRTQYDQFNHRNMGSGGAIEMLADRIVKESNAVGKPIDFMTALSLAQKGAGQGMTYEDGGIAPINGANQAAQDRKFAENYGAKQGDLYAQGSFNLPKQQASFKASQDQFNNINSVINDALSQANKFTTGAGGALTAWVPGSPAYDLKANLDTVLADSSFNSLQEMRNNSPTGGALGAVSERELGLLGAAKRNLQQSQSPQQFVKNLTAYQQQAAQSQQRIAEAYQADVQRFGQQNVPNPQTSTSGIQYADGPNGQVMINRGNGWEHYNGQ
jgi:hypothetical protein